MTQIHARAQRSRQKQKIFSCFASDVLLPLCLNPHECLIVSLVAMIIANCRAKCRDLGVTVPI